MQIKQKRTLKGGSKCTYQPGNHRENMDNCNFSQSQNICTGDNNCTSISRALYAHFMQPGQPVGNPSLNANLMNICKDPSTSVSNLGTANAVALHNYDARCAKIQTGTGKKRRTKKTSKKRTSKSKAKRRTKRTSKSKAKRRTKRTSKSGAKRRTKRASRTKRTSKKTSKSKAKRRTKKTSKKRKSRK